METYFNRDQLQDINLHFFHVYKFISPVYALLEKVMFSVVSVCVFTKGSWGSHVTITHGSVQSCSVGDLSLLHSKPSPLAVHPLWVAVTLVQRP